MDRQRALASFYGEKTWSAVFKRILTVCIGNICRSPTAEYLFHHHLASRGICVHSAGLGALVGKPMDAMARTLLAEHGIDGGEHRARQLSGAMLREADLVLAMEHDHVACIRRLAPEASGKVMLLDHWGAGADIADPFGQSREAFEHVYDVIDRSVASWLPYLTRSAS